MKLMLSMSLCVSDGIIKGIRRFHLKKTQSKPERMKVSMVICGWPCHSLRMAEKEEVVVHDESGQVSSVHSLQCHVEPGESESSKLPSR
ncbi:hypothetical protein PGT21_011079 [Puccinia graminis f. sp. tritici]|uniref:Uncharacterized protein n=1 Tax=Puccinia graminis f. sp. tritici TaxID=56615 RepID=A0A5B0S9F0_PUCGR|nr:hypothetical protein PGT21_011079 [Puccinia graminis f. sp. tritici]KAA1134075.1 hypothetical protein PGTUg99_024383 [Puccinia graminis f. sp. tritici]